MARGRIGNRGVGHMGDDPPICLCKQASLVEHIVHIDGVTGSSPVATTKHEKSELQAGRRRVRISCLYIGEYKYQDVIVPHGIPAIVDEELFDRVQKKMEKNKRAPAHFMATEEYLLTTKLFCGTCGRMMAGESGISATKGVKHCYYKCGGAKRKLGCKRKAVRKEWIERAAVLLTVNRVLKDQEIDRIADAIVVLQEQDDPTLPALNRQLADCEKAIENMLNAIQMGILTESTKELWNSWRNKKRASS